MGPSSRGNALREDTPVRARPLSNTSAASERESLGDLSRFDGFWDPRVAQPLGAIVRGFQTRALLRTPKMVALIQQASRRERRLSYRVCDVVVSHASSTRRCLGNAHVFV